MNDLELGLSAGARLSRRMLVVALLASVGTLGSAQDSPKSPDPVAQAQRAFSQSVKDYRDGRHGVGDALRWSELLFAAAAEDLSTDTPQRKVAKATWLKEIRRVEQVAQGSSPGLEIECMKRSLEAGSTAQTTRAAVAAVQSLLGVLEEEINQGGGDPERFFVWSDRLRWFEIDLAIGTFGEDAAPKVTAEDLDESAASLAHRERIVKLHDTLLAQVQRVQRPRVAGALAAYYLSAAPLDPAERLAHERAIDNLELDEAAPEDPEDRTARVRKEAAQAVYEHTLAQYRVGGESAYRVWLWSSRIPEGLTVRLNRERPQPSKHVLRMRTLAAVAAKLHKTSIPVDVVFLTNREEASFQRDLQEWQRGR